jgi:hypothetical protein
VTVHKPTGILVLEEGDKDSGRRHACHLILKDGQEF